MRARSTKLSGREAHSPLPTNPHHPSPISYSPSPRTHYCLLPIPHCPPIPTIHVILLTSDRIYCRTAPMQRSTTGEPAPCNPRRPLSPAGLAFALFAAYVIIRIPRVVELLLMAVLFATVIERPVAWLERRRFPRGLAVITIELALVAVIVVPAAFIAPAAIRQIDRFRQDEPDRLRAVSAEWTVNGNALERGPGHRLLDRVATELDSPGTVEPRTLLEGAVRVVAGFVGAVAMLAIAYYYATERALLRSVVLRWVEPGSRPRVTHVWDEVERSVGGWLLGRLILGVIVGIVSSIFFALIHLPYWPLLGLLAGLTEPVPIIGPWVGGAPAIFLAFTISVPTALLVAVFVLIRQGVVDSVLVPRITTETVGLSPLIVFLAVLAGTALAGPAGALLAIPVAAAIQVIAADLLAGRRTTSADLWSVGWAWLRRPSGPHSPPGA